MPGEKLFRQVGIGFGFIDIVIEDISVMKSTEELEKYLRKKLGHPIKVSGFRKLLDSKYPMTWRITYSINP